jgi:hypothetical protein
MRRGVSLYVVRLVVKTYPSSHVVRLVVKTYFSSWNDAQRNTFKWYDNKCSYDFSYNSDFSLLSIFNETTWEEE